MIDFLAWVGYDIFVVVFVVVGLLALIGGAVFSMRLAMKWLRWLS